MSGRPRIAIVSMGFRFAGARNGADFLRLLGSRGDASGPVPPGRWLIPPSAAVRSGALGVVDHVPAARGYFVEDEAFSADGLALDADLMGRVDPLFRLTAAVGREAWSGCREGSVDRRRVGLIIGNIALPTAQSSRLAREYLGGAFVEKATGAAAATPCTPPEDAFAAGLPALLLAKGLGLGGTVLTLDAACASSLYALRLAVRELQEGRADAMLTGGVSRPDALYTQMGFAQLKALAPDGVCRPFDQDGSGLVVGEGAGFFVLKRLDDALAHGDEILAVIAGAGLSNDVGGSLMAPSSEGQLRALRAAYAEAGWRPSDVDLIECHATGTPLGDQVEVASLKELWRDDGAARGPCVLGSVKANVGHLLTAAGASSLVKTLLALKHQTKFPTANFAVPASRLGLEGSPFEILTDSVPWQARGARRAAVSGFGFGGINAHVLLEEWQPSARPRPIPARRKPPGQVAVIGVGIERAGLRGERRWFGAEDTEVYRAQFGDAPFDARMACGIDLPMSAFRTPPAELKAALPQQLLMLMAARKAVEQARVGAHAKPDAGVFIGIALDGATNHHSCRWMLGEELRAEFGRELTPDRVMGALGGIVASRVARAFGFGGLGFTVSSEETSGLKALSLGVRAIRAGDLGIALVGAVDAAAHFMQSTARRLVWQGDAPLTGAEDAAVALVLKDAAAARRDNDEILAYVDDEVAGDAQPLAAGRDAGVAAGLLSVAGAIQSLRAGLRPQTSDYWLRDRAAGPRRIVVSARNPAAWRDRAEVLVSEAVEASAPSASPLHKRFALFTLGAASRDLLKASFAALAADLVTLPSDAWPERGRETWKDPQGAFRLALVADLSTPDPRALVRRWHEHLHGGSAVAADAGFYAGESTAAPRLAFVFPGAGSHYRNMGRELAGAFPAVMERHDRDCSHLRSQWGAAAFWAQKPRSPTQTEVLGGQCALAALAVDALAAAGLAPDAAVGYSLGESAALVALRAWDHRDEVFERLRASPLFTSELAGPMDAVRRHWGLAPDEPLRWVNHLVRRSPAAVRAALSGFSRVYLNNINTPHECVIGGDAAQAAAVLARLDAPPLVLASVPALHCPVALEVGSDFLAFHQAALTAPPGVTFYSGARGEALELSSEAAAASILAHAVEGVDFPATVEAAYRDGVRLFIEVGPGAGATRMIREILGGRAHYAASLCAREGQELAAYWAILAACHAAGRPLRLQEHFFFAPAPAPEPGPHLRVNADGAPFNTLKRERVNDMPDPQASWDLSGRAPFNAAPAWLDFRACQIIARGRLADALGPMFAQVDTFPTRVRLPDGPLLLCHRIMGVDAQALSMTGGTLVTEHDVHHDAWYLDDGRIPTCVAVEAGQADLFLAGYLGADFHTRGRAVYRLLDAVVTFHDRLPEPGATIRYEIRIHHFFRQADTILFRFSFEASCGGRPLISMSDGCAGFFSPEALAAGRGIVKTALDLRPVAGKVTGGFSPPVALLPESYAAASLDALRRGDYAACFGASFAALRLKSPKALPDGMLRLVHRITKIEPQGGRYGLGAITGEADVRPDDWFLTCHFVDDRVMPGTLMYECCNHTLRVLLMRLGWVGEGPDLPCEPVPGIASRLKCRGQVVPGTKLVEYRIELKEIGYGPDAYAVADALMLADGRPIVEITDMSICHRGLSKERVDALWQGAEKPALFGLDRILAFSTGKPSEAFGAPYEIFDDPGGRRIARLPRPPYQFLDRVTAVGSEPFAMQAGGKIVAAYDVPPDAWYFGAAASGRMPFAVLLEAALQPCGWYSAYMGSALRSDADLFYRNLGGRAVQHRPVHAATGTLSTEVVATKVSQSAGMIIQEFRFSLCDRDGPVYEGETMFGFFTGEALAKQVGLRGAARPATLDAAAFAAYPARPSLPRAPLLMVDEIVAFQLDPAAARLHGRKRVDPAEWFFAAHFYQDPVMPGSLGLEAGLQLLMLAAAELWPDARGFQAVTCGEEHSWTYRGQVVPQNARTDVVMDLGGVDHAARILRGDGILLVDGLPIYEMKGFSVQAL